MSPRSDLHTVRPPLFHQTGWDILAYINWHVWVFFSFNLLIFWLFGDLGSLLMYVCQCFSPDAAMRRRWSRPRASRSGFTLLVFASLTGLAGTNKHHTPTLIPPFPSHTHKAKRLYSFCQNTQRTIAWFDFLFFLSQFFTLYVKIPDILGNMQCAT